MNKRKSRTADGAGSTSQKWKVFRERAGLTQKDVSDALGYSTPQFVSNVERGRCKFPVEKLPKIKRLYRLSTEQIVDLLMHDQRQNLRRFFKSSAG